MKFDQKELFLDETYSRLANAVGPEHAANITVELGEHLELAQQELEDRGLEPALAQRAAFDRMGTPKKIAEGFLFQSSSAPNLMWSFCLLGILLAAVAVSFHQNWHGAKFGIVVLFLILGPFIVVTLTKRPLRWIAMGVGSLAICGYLMADAARNPFVNDQGFVSYERVRSDYLSLKKEHSDLLHREAKLATYFHTQTGFVDQGATMYVPSIRYFETQPGYGYRRSSSNSVWFSPKQEESATFVWAAMGGGASMKHSEVYDYIERTLAEIRSRQSQRKKEVGARVEILNTSFVGRSLASLPDVSMFILGALTSWLVTFGVSRLYVATRTRARRLA